MKRVYKDFFFHFDIMILFMLLCLGIGFMIITGITFISGVFFLGGMLGFVFSEYFTHRFLFHLKAPKHPFFLKLLKRLHYDHHTYPNDLKLLFLPLWYSLPNFLIFSAIVYLITHNFLWTVSFGMGLMAMLLTYEWKHYVAHRPIKPKTRFGQWIKKVHILHHYKNENYWFGVSNPFTDVIFGTFAKEKEVETSHTVKDLEKRA